eukprot:Rhum_TRINITY_DN14923_c4_g1::Rhum_TRINITY_DN14923_c4_g1_i1::g.132165::m.132165
MHLRGLLFAAVGVSAALGQTCGAGYACPTGYVRKPNGALITCPANTGCFAAVCCDVTCSAFTCPSPKTKPTPATPTLQCNAAGTFGLLQTCEDKCCTGPTAPTCKAWNDATGTGCSAGWGVRANAASIACHPVVGCHNQECCEVLCGHTRAIACPVAASTVRRSATHKCNPGTTNFAQVPEECTVERCCTSTCEHHSATDSCPLSTLLKPKATVCAEYQNCQDHECCTWTCGVLGDNCGPNHFNPVSSWGNPVAGSTVAALTAACCKPYCRAHTCSMGWIRDTAPGVQDQECTGGTCSDIQCCRITCSASNVCTASGALFTGGVAKPAAANTVCSTDALEAQACVNTAGFDICCQRTCLNHACDLVRSYLRPSPEGKNCADKDTCTHEECCYAVCYTDAVAAPAAGSVTATLTLVAPVATQAITCPPTRKATGVHSPLIKCQTSGDNLDYSGCTPDKCCEKYTCGDWNGGKCPKLCDCPMGNPTCDRTKLDCPESWIPKAATTECIEGDIAKCDAPTCCQMTCWHSDVACPVGFQKKPVPTGPLGAWVCGDLAGCSTAVCCDRICNHADDEISKKCGLAFPNLVPKPSLETTTCAAHDKCTTDECCLPTCHSYTCTNTPASEDGKWTKKTDPVTGANADITCENGTCDDATCCDKTCFSYTCSRNGYDNKPTAAARKAIVCPGSVCSDLVCCDPICNLATFSCGDGYFSKSPAAAQNTRCTAKTAGGALYCTNEVCCDKSCTHPTAKALCVAPNLKTRGKAAEVGCGANNAACTATLCCDNTCATHTCKANFALKVEPLPSVTSCRIPANDVNTGNGAPTSECTHDLCCDATCGGYTGCAAAGGYVTKVAPVPTAILCGPQASDCTPTKCCDVTCAHPSSLACDGVKFQRKSNAQSLTCGPLVADCTDKMGEQVKQNFCCDAYCPSFTPSMGYKYRTITAHTTIKCGALAHECNDALCADAYCNNPAWECSAGFQKKTTSANLKCDTKIPSTTDASTIADCVDRTCCDAYCSHSDFACDNHYVKKSDAATLKCGAVVGQCTNTLCCSASCSSTDFYCALGFEKKATASEIRCAGAASSSCTTELCCNRVADNAGVAARASLARTSCCSSNADCQLHGDSAGVCLPGIQGCQCSAHFEHKTENGKVITLCFPKDDAELEVLVTIRTTKDVRAGPTPASVTESNRRFTTLKANIATAASAVAWKGVNFMATSTYYYMAGTLRLKRADVFQDGTGLAKEIQKLIVNAPEDSVLYAFLPLQSGDAVTVEVASPASITGSHPFACATLATDSQATRTVRTPTASKCLSIACNANLVYNTDQALYGSTYRTFRCQGGSPSTRHCSGDFECAGTDVCDDSLVTDTTVPYTGLCATKKSVALTPCKDASIAADTAFGKDWCVRDADCRNNGDAAAHCSKDFTLGNWCVCSANHAYPHPFLPICMGTGTLPSTVEVSFEVNFGSSLPCPITATQLSDVRALVAKALGGVVSMNQYCTPAFGAVFLGTVDVSLDLAKVLAVKDGAYVKGLLETAATATRAVDVLASFGSLNNFQIQSAGVGALIQCNLVGASSTSRLPDGSCQALACDAYHVLHTSQSTSSCVRKTDEAVKSIDDVKKAANMTAVPQVEDDDELTDGQTIGIVFGAIGVVVLLILAAVLCATKKSPAPEPEPENKAAPSNEPFEQ